MTSHAEIRAAYESWCDANPFLPVEQYPDLEQMIEAADSEPVDRAFKADLKYSAATSQLRARLGNVELTDKILIEGIQWACLNMIEELEQTPDDIQSLRWLIPFQLYAAKTYEMQYVYAGMYKHASAARAHMVKMGEKGFNVGPGSPYNEWRRCAMQNCVKALEKMLEVGLHQQWVAEMVEREEREAWTNEEEEEDEEEDEEDEGWGTDTDVEDPSDDLPGLTYSTSTVATSRVPTTPPSKKARGTLRRMGEEDEDDGGKA